MSNKSDNKRGFSICNQFLGLNDNNINPQIVLVRASQ